MYSHHKMLSAVAYPDLACRLAEVWAPEDDLGGGRFNPQGTPQWRSLQLTADGPPKHVPDEVTDRMSSRATAWLPRSAGIRYIASSRSNFGRRQDAAVVRELVEDLTSPKDPHVLFGRTLRTSFFNGLSFTPQHTPTVAQSDVHLPDGL